MKVKAPSLSDEILAATYDPERRLMEGTQVRHLSAGSKPALMTLRATVRSARKYLINDDLMPVIAQASTVDPNRMKYAFNHARAPYDTTWIEWDEHSRIIELAKTGITDLNLEGVPTRVGVLIERIQDHESEALYKATIFSSDDRIAVLPVGFIYNTDGQSVRSDIGSINRLLNIGIQEVQGTKLPVLAMGPRWAIKWMGKIGQEWPNRLRNMYGEVPDLIIKPEYTAAMMELSDAFAFIPSPLYRGYIEKMLTEGGNNDRRNQFYAAIATAITGDLRWIIATLGVLHTFRVAVIETNVKPGGSGIVLGRHVPYMEHHTIKISLPKERAVDQIERQWGDSHGSTGRRRHEVAGHWCHSKKDPKKKWWRKSHLRGRGDIGYVAKDYELVHS